MRLATLAAHLVACGLAATAFALGGASAQIFPHRYDAGYQMIPDPAAMGLYTIDGPAVLPSWGIKCGTVILGACRYEVREGQEAVGDVGRTPKRARQEKSGSALKKAYDVTYHFHMAQRLTCVDITPGRQIYVGQVHASDDAGDAHPSHPALAWRWDSRTQLRITYSGSVDDNTTIVDSTAHTDASFQCGQWYRYKVDATFSKTAAGALKVWRMAPGATSYTVIVDLTNINMGYNDVNGWYMKSGVYAYDSPETLVAEYACPIDWSPTDFAPPACVLPL